MDQHKLRNLVFEKTGVKVDTDDPIFALVALNEAVLAETVERHVALIEAATEALLAQVATLAAVPASAQERRSDAPAGAGPAAAPFIALLPSVAASPLARPIPTQATRLLARREIRLLSAAAGLSLLSALVVVGVQQLLGKPAPAAAPLTAQQASALRQGEKLARAVQKLDQKSRNLIEAEMHRP